MATDRLTRQELSWLLAQEARAAASLLRKGVSGLKIEEAPKVSEVSSTLDALDDAVRTLATLQTGGATHSRRGRIDVAALLLELAPHASINLEPGSGTEIFAEESELRRMLQVLLSLGAPAGEGSSTSICVRRHGDEIRVEVTLGPDSSGAAHMEQAWLHRMAVRHGGTLALEGGLVALGLPPAGSEQREVEELRRELAAAQQQGEMYAREIAAMFAHVPEPEPEAQAQGPQLAAFCGALGALLRPEIAALREGAEGERGARAHALLAVVDVLDRFARLDPRAASTPIELERAVQVAVSAAEVRADRRGVRLESSAASLGVLASSDALSLLLDLLIDHAIEATSSGAAARVAVESDAGKATLLVDDAGAAVPRASRPALLALSADGSSLGRPRSVNLGLAAALAARMGLALSLDDAPSGGLRVRVRF